VSATGSNRYATKEVGEPTHHGDPGGVSVWWKWTSPVSPVDLTISTCGSDIATKLGVYTGSSVGALTPVSGTYAASCAQADVFRFTTDPSTTYRIAVDGLNTAIEEGGVETQAGQAIQLGLASKPVNDDLANASTLAGTLPSSTTGNNLAATKEVGEGNHAGQPGGTSVWYRWTAPSSGVTTVDTCGSPIDTLLDVYANAISYPVGAAIASNDDGCGGASAQSKLTFNAVASTTYLIAVDAAGAGGDFQLEIADKTAPSVTIDSAPTGTISDNTPTFTFHANEAGSTFECSLTTGSSNFLPCANPFTPASPLADGDYTFKVRAVDASVNTGAPLTRTFTVDTTGPTTTFHKTPPKKITIPRKQVKVRFGFKSEKNATFECKLDKAAYAACDSPVAYKVSWGRHHFKVRAKDTLGNLGPKIAYAFKVIHQT
jgi:hypothetical protein